MVLEIRPEIAAMSKEEIIKKLETGGNMLQQATEILVSIRGASGDLSKTPFQRLDAITAMLDEMGVPEPKS